MRWLVKEGWVMRWVIQWIGQGCEDVLLGCWWWCSQVETKQWPTWWEVVVVVAVMRTLVALGGRWASRSCWMVGGSKLGKGKQLVIFTTSSSCWGWYFLLLLVTFVVVP